MGLLDREGADEKAKIRQVAGTNDDHRGGSQMDPKDNKTMEGADDMMVDPSTLDDAGMLALVKKLQAEVGRLTKANEELQKKLDGVEAERKAEQRKAAAEKLMQKIVEAGREFDGEAAKAEELKRLQGLSDEAFAATEATVQAFAAGKKKSGETEEEKKKREEEEARKKEEEEADKKKKAKADLNADAGKHPVPSPDLESGTLAEKLAAGFSAAYEERAGN
jgi:membrane protein involved in colicin uptake